MPYRRKKQECNSILHFASNTLKLIFLTCLMTEKCVAIENSTTSVSRQAQCAVDCYAKCANDKISKIDYCNCSFRHNKLEACNSFFKKEKINEHLSDKNIHFSSVYKDAYTISIQTDEFPNAFAYIFEYSTVNFDGWNYIGALGDPYVIFTIPDSCRDYQFRIIIVLKSTETDYSYLILKPKLIPVDLPVFAILPNLVTLEQPKESHDGQFLHTMISWQNPSGYSDKDIYTYESPIAYPIRCMIPEERLTPAKIERIDGGARMHLNLPIDVLQEKCRIYVETQIVPKCVRIPSYDIQASIEIDCQKFSELKYCKKEMSPQCSDVVDIWGQNDGAVIIVWQPVESTTLQNMKHLRNHEHLIGKRKSFGKEPLYYSLYFGQTKTQGHGPLMHKKIINPKEFKIPGNITKHKLFIDNIDIEYGIQICGIYSNEIKVNNILNIAAVVGFQCSKCKEDKLLKDSRCIQCLKVDEMVQTKVSNNKIGLKNVASGALIASTSNNTTLEELPTNCFKSDCILEQNHSIHYIASNSAVLNILLPKNNITNQSFNKSINSKNLISSLDEIAYNDRETIFKPEERQSKIIETNRIIPLKTNIFTLTTTSKKPTINELEEYEKIKASATIYTIETTSSTQNIFSGSSKIFETNLTSTIIDSTLTTTTQIPITTNLFKLTSMFNKNLLTTTTTTTTTTKNNFITTEISIINKKNVLKNNLNSMVSDYELTAKLNKSNVIQTSTILTTKLNEKNDKIFATKLLSLVNNSTLFSNKNISDNFGEFRHFNDNTNFDENITLFSDQSDNEFIMHKLPTLNIETTTTNKFINESNTNTDIIVGKVEFVNATKWNEKENNNLPKNNSTLKVQTNKNERRRWRQNSSKTFIKQKLCKQKNGIICEYGCIDEEKCECTKEQKKNKKNCVRGLSCQLVSDIQAKYDNKTQTVKLFSKKIANLLKNQTIFNKMFMEFGELIVINGTNHSNNLINKNNESLIYDFVSSSEKQHFVVSLNKLNFNEFLLFDKIPFEVTINKKLNIIEKIYGINLCFLNSTLVPIIFDNNINDKQHFDSIQSNYKMPNGEIDQNLISAYAQTLLSPIEMRNIIALNNLEIIKTSDNFQLQTISIHRLVVFIGPLFFILGMLVFGLSLLCMSIMRSRRRQNLRRSTLKYNTNNIIPKALLKYNNGAGITRNFLNTNMPSTTSISAPIFSNSMPTSLLQNLTSLQTVYNSTNQQQQKQPELHRYNINKQTNINSINENGNSTITATLGATNSNNILYSNDLLSNSNITNESTNNIIKENYYIKDNNNNLHNRHYGHRNVYF